MKIRFGYVANALGLWDASPSKSLTFTRFKALSENERMNKLLSVTAQNLEHARRILHYNIAHEIKLYRFSSSLIPLATHPEVMWDYLTPFKAEWEEIGYLVNHFHMRPSFHPNQFTLFTSQKQEITRNAVKDMEYHYSMLRAMNGLDNGLINIHIGGAYGDKKKALQRFRENLKLLPSYIKNLMTLENDDKTYTVEETLKICEKEGVPMILDYHHFKANSGEEELSYFLPRIFSTWEKRNIHPKVHLSSPKSENEFRSHANFVSLDFVLPFLKMAKELNRDFDVMIEAKQKDLAMLKLVEEISSIRGVKRVSSSEVEW